MTTQLGYQRSGSGKTLVMQHGYLGSSALWQAQIDYFSREYDVITPELAGHGLSAHMQGPESIAEAAQLVFDLLDELGVKEFMLIGHSMGGMIVQQMALMQPARISRLVCFGTGPVGLLPNRFETLAESRSARQGFHADIGHLGRQGSFLWLEPAAGVVARHPGLSACGNARLCTQRTYGKGGNF